MNKNEYINEYIISESCKIGNIELIKWILYYDYVISDNNYKTFFCIACESGQLDTAKFLYLNTRFNIPYDYQAEILTIFCNKGYYEMMEWFLSVYPDVLLFLDYYQHYELFFQACDNYNLNIAKLLFMICPYIPINLNNDFLFIKSCEVSMTDLSKMLQEMRPEAYYLRMDDYNEIVHYEVMRTLVIKNKVYLEKEKKECTICYENEANVITYCQHMYCFECLEMHYSRNNINCPCCRRPNHENDLCIIYDKN